MPQMYQYRTSYTETEASTGLGVARPRTVSDSAGLAWTRCQYRTSCSGGLAQYRELPFPSLRPGSSIRRVSTGHRGASA
eukprot:3940611-Rhodomonas_salina.2